MADVYISLGSNLGDKLKNLQMAICKIAELEGISVEKVSSVYKTEPVGYTEQDWFLNAAAQLKTTLSPIDILKQLLSIEDQMGRIRTIRWGPRVIDLDLLLYDNLVIEAENLDVPHPRIIERAFVLVPMLEINPSLELPSGKRLKDYLANMDYQKEVLKISENLSCK